MRSLLTPLGTFAAVFALAQAIAAHDWLIVSAAGVLVAVGIWFLAPGSSEHPVPARAPEEERGQRGRGS